MHALGNVAVFDTHTTIPPERISYALNQRLPEDIVIVKSEEVAKIFIPGTVTAVRLTSTIFNMRIPIPTKRLTNYFVSYDLDVEKMRKAAGYLIGEHDFVSFCNVRTDVEDTVRTVTELENFERWRGDYDPNQRKWFSLQHGSHYRGNTDPCRTWIL